MKLAAKIARRLEDRILAEGWPVGHQIGRETDMATEMGVSRWTFREAVRILESSGFVVTRKGARGGLFVASNAHDFVCRTITNYLEFVQISPDEFANLFRGFGSFALMEAIDTLAAPERARLAAQLAALPELPFTEQVQYAADIQHALIRGARNPALLLFMDALTRITIHASIYSSLDDAGWMASLRLSLDQIVRMATAVLACDRRAAEAANADFVETCRRKFDASLIHRRLPLTPAATERAYAVSPPARAPKKVDRVEREIREMIIEAGWPVGANLGSEVELAKRFGVGRPVLREALRSLEQMGVIAMGRGSSSGLRVVSPDPAAIAQACCRHLRREGLTPVHAPPLLAILQELSVRDDRPSRLHGLFAHVLQLDCVA